MRALDSPRAATAYQAHSQHQAHHQISMQQGTQAGKPTDKGAGRRLQLPPKKQQENKKHALFLLLLTNKISLALPGPSSASPAVCTVSVWFPAPCPCGNSVTDTAPPPPCCSCSMHARWKPCTLCVGDRKAWAPHPGPSTSTPCMDRESGAFGFTAAAVVDRASSAAGWAEGGRRG